MSCGECHDDDYKHAAAVAMRTPLIAAATASEDTRLPTDGGPTEPESDEAASACPPDNPECDGPDGHGLPCFACYGVDDGDVRSMVKLAPLGIALAVIGLALTVGGITMVTGGVGQMQAAQARSEHPHDYGSTTGDVSELERPSNPSRGGETQVVGGLIVAGLGGSVVYYGANWAPPASSGR